MSKDNHQRKLAVLIDGDNAAASGAGELFAEIAKYGTASVRRIYGDWSKPHLGGWQKILLKHAITPVQQFSYTTGKNASDISMVIDALDLLYSDTFDGFCLVSSDSDFTPLASRIRASGLKVYGFGERKTPQAFRNACDQFIYTENLQAENENAVAQKSDNEKTDVETPTDKPVKANLRQPVEGALRSLLYKALKDTTDDSGWAFVGHIGSYLNQTQPDFDPRSYGYGKLSSMLKALGGLQFRHDDASRMYCRKIPYGEFRALLCESVARFQDKNGSASVNALEKYLKPRFSWKDYGFEDLESFLSTVHGVQVEGDRVRVSQPKAASNGENE